MKLAVLCVYMFDQTTEGLARIQLDRLRRHTKCRYSVYGSVSKLDNRGRALLSEYSEVTQIDTGAAEGFREDHNHQLEGLRHQAKVDGSDRFITLHLDSFPLSDDWLAVFEAGLEMGAAFSSIVPYCFNAGLYWDVAWENQSASMLGDPMMRDQFASAHPHLDGNDGGVGFFHHAFSNGLCWHSVEQSHTNVWSFVLFHLVGSTRLTSLDVIPARIPKPLRLARGVASPVLTMLPVRLRSRIIQRLRSPFTVKEHSTARDGTMSDKRARLGELLEDPDGFLEHCLSETD